MNIATGATAVLAFSALFAVNVPRLWRKPPDVAPVLLNAITLFIFYLIGIGGTS